MRSTLILAAAVLTSALFGAGCPPAPAKDYTVAELGSVGDLTEIMRVLAQRADPWFSRRTDTSFTDEDFAKMTADADHVEAAARTAGGPLAAGRPEGFPTFAKGLEAASGKWREAAKAKDAAAVGAALETMRGQCKGCHSAYR